MFEFVIISNDNPRHDYYWNMKAAEKLGRPEVGRGLASVTVGLSGLGKIPGQASEDRPSRLK